MLEVGCGRGGGAAWLSKNRKPKQMVGLDYSKVQIEFCNKRHDGKAGLSFVHGDALALPFPDATFDFVLSVESSHCYADMAGFLSEVNRVMKPGGAFVFADFRDNGDEVDLLERQFVESALEVEAFDDITPQVVAALDMDHERKVSDCLPMVPSLLRGFVSMFIGTKGSRTYENFRTRKWVYRRARLVQSDAKAAPS